MPVKKQWAITYAKCGHSETKDLSDRKPDKRAGFAAWLAENSTCTACWRQSRGLPPQGDWIEDKQEWLAKVRAQEQKTADDWAEKTQMPQLVGSDKAVAWASRVRYELMHQLYTWAIEEDNGPDDYEPAEDMARSIDRASWWLDQREQADQDPEALLELLRAAAADSDGVECENID